jgi:hypothetical protein
MKAVCSHCGKDLGPREGPEGAITHGICEECAQIVLEDYKKQRQLPPRELFLIATRTERAARMADMPPMVSIADGYPR